MTPEDLEAELTARIDPVAADWLDEARALAGEDPKSLRVRFPAAARTVGRGMLREGADLDDPFEWTVDDAARALLLVAAGPTGRADEVPGLYLHGDAREKRACLRAVDVVGAAPWAEALIADALRTNDTRLMAAALGPTGIAALDDEALAQAVLKCVFVGLDLTRLEGLQERVTPNMSRMLADFVHERIAAGRDVPATVWPVIDAHPPAERLALIEAELTHPTPQRAAAASAALTKRRVPWGGSAAPRPPKG